MKPAFSSAVILSCASASESPASGTRLRYGIEIVPSVSTRYLPVNSVSSETMIDRLSCGPMTYPSVGAPGVAGSLFGWPPLRLRNLEVGLVRRGWSGRLRRRGPAVAPAAASVVFARRANRRQSRRGQRLRYDGVLAHDVVPLLLRDPDERNAQLSSLPIQIWTLNTERLGGGRHPPLVVLQHRCDVVALETLTRLLAELPDGTNGACARWSCSTGRICSI